MRHTLETVHCGNKAQLVICYFATYSASCLTPILHLYHAMSGLNLIYTSIHIIPLHFRHKGLSSAVYICLITFNVLIFCYPCGGKKCFVFFWLMDAVCYWSMLRHHAPLDLPLYNLNEWHELTRICVFPDSARRFLLHSSYLSLSEARFALHPSFCICHSLTSQGCHVKYCLSQYPSVSALSLLLLQWWSSLQPLLSRTRMFRRQIAAVQRQN